MAEINWNLLDTSLPQKIGQNFIDAPARAQENALRQMAYDKAMQDAQDDKSLRGIVGQYGGDLNGASDAAMRAGMWKPAQEMRKQEAEAKKAQIAQALEALKLTQEHAARVMANPTEADAIDAITQVYRVTGQDPTQEIAKIQAMKGDPAAIYQYAAGRATEASQLLPKLDKWGSPTEGNETLIARNPLTGAVMNQTTIPRTAADKQSEGTQLKGLLNVLAPGKFNVAFDQGGDWQVMPVSGSVGVNENGTFANNPQQPTSGMFDPSRLAALNLSQEQADVLATMLASGNKTASGQAARQLMQLAFPKPGAVPSDMQRFRAYQAMTPQERAAYQEFSKFQRPGTNVSINNVMPDEAAKRAGQKEGFDIGEQAAAIEKKYSALDSVREAREIMAKGIYAGTYGDFQKMMAKGTLGMIGDRQKAINTEEFLSYVGNTVVPRLAEFGGNDSNEEMRYLRSIMGGDTSMEPEAIKSILESAERKIQRGIERLQRQRGALQSGEMPDLGPGPSRNAAPRPAPARQQARPQAPAQPAAKTSGVRKYNPATGRIE